MDQHSHYQPSGSPVSYTHVRDLDSSDLWRRRNGLDPCSRRSPLHGDNKRHDDDEAARHQMHQQRDQNRLMERMSHHHVQGQTTKRKNVRRRFNLSTENRMDIISPMNASSNWDVAEQRSEDSISSVESSLYSDEDDAALQDGFEQLRKAAIPDLSPSQEVDHYSLLKTAIAKIGWLTNVLEDHHKSSPNDRGSFSTALTASNEL